MVARCVWLAVALVACRERDAPAPKPADPRAPAPATATKTSTPGPRPELAVADAAGPPPTNAAEAFAAEQADPGWKSTTEATLRTKLAHLHGGPPPIECRRTTCLVIVTAPEREAKAALDDLDTLRPIAQNVTFTAPEQADGKLTVHAYVRFERPAAEN